MSLFNRKTSRTTDLVVEDMAGKKMLSDHKFELYVGKTTTLENTTLMLEGNARIDGRVSGKIKAKQLEIGPDGTFTGNVEAERIILDGTLDSGEQAISSCLLYTSPSPRDKRQSRMPSSA